MSRLDYLATLNQLVKSTVCNFNDDHLDSSTVLQQLKEGNSTGNQSKAMLAKALNTGNRYSVALLYSNSRQLKIQKYFVLISFATHNCGKLELCSGFFPKKLLFSGWQRLFAPKKVMTNCICTSSCQRTSMSFRSFGKTSTSLKLFNGSASFWDPYFSPISERDWSNSSPIWGANKEITPEVNQL